MERVSAVFITKTDVRAMPAISGELLDGFEVWEASFKDLPGCRWRPARVCPDAIKTFMAGKIT